MPMFRRCSLLFQDLFDCLFAIVQEWNRCFFNGESNHHMAGHHERGLLLVSPRNAIKFRPEEYMQEAAACSDPADRTCGIALLLPQNWLYIACIQHADVMYASHSLVCSYHEAFTFLEAVHE
ncbi:hypothetical protein MRB53_041678 [Persea americana]|nr:hypothetical protein MRB53_041678 [Persea americana]